MGFKGKQKGGVLNFGGLQKGTRWAASWRRNGGGGGPVQWRVDGEGGSGRSAWRVAGGGRQCRAGGDNTHMEAGETTPLTCGPGHSAGHLNPFKSINAIQMDLNSNQTRSNFI
jgi:hypothetical protein